jgi:hypothetical protein
MCVLQTTPVTKKVEYACTMSRKADVETTDYVPGERVREYDGEGYVSFPDADDFSDTDWLSEYKDQHLTPAVLIDILGNVAAELAQGKVPQKATYIWKHIANECQDWKTEDESADM